MLLGFSPSFVMSCLRVMVLAKESVEFYFFFPFFFSVIVVAKKKKNLSFTEIIRILIQLIIQLINESFMDLCFIFQILSIWRIS